MKRTISTEIIDKLNRQNISSKRFEPFESKYLMMLQNWDNFLDKNRSNKIKSEYANYLVVVIIAIIESYSRVAIKDLLNSGKGKVDFLKNANIPKPDYEILQNIQSGRFTTGDYFSHCLPISSIRDIEKYFEFLTGNSYWGSLLETRINPNKPELKAVYFKKEILAAKACLPHIFSWRHIICHEPCSSRTPKASLISNNLVPIFFFLMAFDTYIRRFLGEYQ
jgi:hypothetical protein